MSLPRRRHVATMNDLHAEDVLWSNEDDRLAAADQLEELTRTFAESPNRAVLLERIVSLAVAQVRWVFEEPGRHPDQIRVEIPASRRAVLVREGDVDVYRVPAVGR